MVLPFDQIEINFDTLTQRKARSTPSVVRLEISDSLPYSTFRGLRLSFLTGLSRRGVRTYRGRHERRKRQGF